MSLTVIIIIKLQPSCYMNSVKLFQWLLYRSVAAGIDYRVFWIDILPWIFFHFLPLIHVSFHFTLFLPSKRPQSFVRFSVQRTNSPSFVSRQRNKFLSMLNCKICSLSLKGDLSYQLCNWVSSAPHSSQHLRLNLANRQLLRRWIVALQKAICILQLSAVASTGAM